jgi:hypothetical protein
MFRLQRAVQLLPWGRTAAVGVMELTNLRCAGVASTSGAHTHSSTHPRFSGACRRPSFGSLRDNSGAAVLSKRSACDTLHSKGRQGSLVVHNVASPEREMATVSTKASDKVVKVNTVLG